MRYINLHLLTYLLTSVCELVWWIMASGVWLWRHRCCNSVRSFIITWRSAHARLP